VTQPLSFGVDARTIAHLLGHSDLETRLRYLRSASQETKDHGDKLEAAFAGRKRAKAAKVARNRKCTAHVMRNGSGTSHSTLRSPI
jgi:hypothetical protein